MLYLLSDVVESLQSGFGTAQLWLTLVAEAAIPVIVLGLAVAQSPRLGRTGWIGAWIYAYAYVFFCGTVVYALVKHTPTYALLSDALEPWMLIHGGLMVVGGLAFGSAVIAARVLPRWPAVALMLGVVLVAATQSAPEAIQLIAAAVRDLGFAGMGAALLMAPAAVLPRRRPREVR